MSVFVLSLRISVIWICFGFRISDFTGTILPSSGRRPPSTRRLKPPFQVSPQIVGVLQADAEANQIVGDLRARGSLGRGDHRVGKGQALEPSPGYADREEFERVAESSRIASQAEGKEPARPLKLSLPQGMRWKERPPRTHPQGPGSRESETETSERSVE